MFVDGGLWANNPVLVGLIDALDMAEPDQEIHIFSLGTCPLPAGEQIQNPPSIVACPIGNSGVKPPVSRSMPNNLHSTTWRRKLARHVDRRCTVIRFPSEKVPAALIPPSFPGRNPPEAIRALINQARTDADMTNSKCAYSDSDPEAALICALFESAHPSQIH